MNEQSSGEPVTVLATGDPALLAVAKSLLEEADIDFFAKGEAIQDLVGLGRLAGFNPAVGPVELQVAPEHADEARALLRELTEIPPDGGSQ